MRIALFVTCWADTLFPATGRDPRVFECPEEIRFDRAPNPHLGFGAGDLSWVFNAYVVALGGLLLLGGRLSDLFGAKRVFTAGWVVLAGALLALLWAAIWAAPSTRAASSTTPPSSWTSSTRRRVS